MTMAEIVSEISFRLGLSVNDNTEELPVEKAVTTAFREMRRYMNNPVYKTVPFANRIVLADYGIKTKQIKNVLAARPRIGLTLTTIDSGNVFEVAAAAGIQTQIGNTSNLNLDPIITQLAMAQVRNTMNTDYQWVADYYNGVLQIAHRSPRPHEVTIEYVPYITDVSEIFDETWIDYLIRLSEAYWKKSAGRSRSKFKIAGSNVELDGEQLLSEANAELEQIREELSKKKNHLVVLN